jgi:hypothetical protein
MAQPIPKDSLLYAGKLLDQLRDLDATVHGAYYDMGRILSSIMHGHLYDALGYDSMGYMIEEELSYSASQGFRYLHTYRHFKRLGYTKTEALDLINEFSFTYMAKVLPGLKEKVGKRAVGNAIERLLKESRQINFQLNESDLKLLIKVLKEFGAEPRDGRLMNSSQALIEMAKAAALG